MARAAVRAHLRLARVGLHLLAGLATVAIVHPLASHDLRQRLKRRWSRQLLAILGLRLELRGHVKPGALIVANHVSWVDIFVINAVCPSVFVSKSEVRQWPGIGWLAAKTDTLFIERGRHRHAQAIAHKMAQLLARRRSVAIFPEGTTSDGSALLPFHAALLQPAVSTGAAVQPVAIAYRDRCGRPASEPTYAGETSFMASLRAIVAADGLSAIVHCPAVIGSAGRDRRQLAADSEACIGQALYEHALVWREAA